jgi:hypothetical protein
MSSTDERRRELAIFLDTTRSTRSNNIGNSHRWTLQAPIQLKNAVQGTAKLSIYNANIPYIWENIGSDIGYNTMVISVNGDVLIMVFQDGMYSLDVLSDVIGLTIQTEYPTITDDQLPYLSYEPYNGYVQFIMPAQPNALLRITWLKSDPLDAIGKFLGFPKAGNIVQTATTTTYTADSSALINDGITNCLVTCNIISNSILNTDTSARVIASIYPVNTKVLGIINYSPSVPLQLPVTYSTINDIEISLLRSDGSDLNLLQEPYTITLVLSWIDKE